MVALPSRKRFPWKYCKQNTGCDEQHHFYDGKKAISEGMRSLLADASFAYRVTCADDSYPKDARLAWSPMIGARFMPPIVKSEGQKLKISCGDPQHKTKLVWLGALGRDSAFRKHGVYGIELPNVADCCPPGEIMGTAHYKGNHPRWKDRKHFVGTKRKYDKEVACFRKELGKSSSLRCTSEFDFKIFECKGCACKNANGQLDLMKFENSHNLASKAPALACKPWFLYVDLMIRNQMAKLRQTLMANKLEKCK